MRRRRHGPEVFRITGARQGLAEDVRGRERRYVISMLVRTAAVLVTVLLWNVQRPLAVATLVLGAALPYVAVVIANAGRENTPSLPDSYLSAPPRQALGPAEPGPAPQEPGPAPQGRTIRQEPDRPDGAPGPGPEPRPGSGAEPEQEADRPRTGPEPRRAEPGRETSRPGPGRRR